MGVAAPDSLARTLPRFTSIARNSDAVRQSDVNVIRRVEIEQDRLRLRNVPARHPAPRVSAIAAAQDTVQDRHKKRARFTWVVGRRKRANVAEPHMLEILPIIRAIEPARHGGGAAHHLTLSAKIHAE